TTPPKLDETPPDTGTTTPSSTSDTPPPPKLDDSPPSVDNTAPKLDEGPANVDGSAPGKLPDNGTTAQGSRDISDANTTPRANDTPTVDRTACGDPIDVSTGRVMMTQEDVELAGALPLVLSRTHLSSYRIGRAFGGSWASTVDQRVEVDAEELHFAAEDGTLLSYPRPAVDVDMLPVTGPAWPATRAVDGTYVITQPDKRRTLSFSGVSGRLIAISDLAGYHHIRFDYDDAGSLTTITHSAGYRLGVTTSGGLITSLTLLSGGQPLELARYRYNERAQLVEVVNSSGIPLSFDYDTEGRLAGWVDRNGMWYRYSYDAAGRCVRAEGKDGHLNYALRYEELRTTATDSLGKTTVYQLNSAFQVIGETDPLGNLTRSEWDDRDRLLSRTDPLGRTTRYRYDEAGNLLSTRYPDGSEAMIAYDEQGRPVRLTEPGGGVWLREYTGDGDLSAVVDPLGARTEFGYRLPGQLATMTDPLGNVTRYEYDSAGLPVSVTDPLGSVATYSYDRFGRLDAETGPLGAVTRTAWTIEGAPLANVWPDGWTQRFTHDGEGNLRETADGFGLVRTAFGAFDRPTTHIAPDGSRIELGYDTESRIVAITNQQGLVWRYTYDAAGRLVAETDFNGRTRTYGYDKAGQLVEQVNAVGQRVRLDHDALGRIVRREVDGVVTSYEFDVKGRLVRARNADAELVLEYDAMDRVLKEIVNGRVLSSSYDRAGRRVRRVTPTGARSDWRYDPAGQPTALQTGGRTLSFRFDAAGREIERRIGVSVLRQSWDSRDRLIAQSVVSGPAGQAQSGEQRTYGYRQDGTLTSVEDRNSGPRTYDLDPLGRVVAVRGAGWNERYAYDSAGNLLQPDSRVYTGTLLSRDNTAQYEYDAAGRLLVRRVGPNSAWHYSWDGEDRLVAVRTPGGQQWRYRYDPLGRRIAKELLAPESTTPPAARPAILSQTTFTWDGTQLAEEVSDGVRALVWDWEPGGHRVLAQSERALHQGSRQWRAGRVHAVVTDLAGAPTELVDAEGGPGWRGKLTLWGLAPRPMPTPLRFPGQYHDQETGLHYNVHRYYDPATARYLSPDPLGLEPATNPYAYVSNPTTWIDPLGLTPCKLSFQQAHSTPSGSSLDLRGPRKSGKTGATPNQVTDPSRWNDITSKAGVTNPYKQRLSFSQDAQTMADTKPGLGRDIHRQAMDQNLAKFEDTNRSAIENMGRNDPNTKGFWEQQDRRDAHVANQSNERAQNYQPNPELEQSVDDRLRPVLEPSEGVQSLLGDHPGVIMGGEHGPGHPAWNVLQNNMQDLKNAGVNKIYLESLRDDAYGEHVRNYLNSPPGTEMHPDLQRFINASTNNEAMGQVIDQAKQVGGIDVVGLGGNPARRDLLGDAGMYQRHAMMNSYGAEAIDHYQQANPGKYVAEVGQAHAQPHTWNGSSPVNISGVNLPTSSPGIGQLVNAPSVKWNDAGNGLTRIDDGMVNLG
ncbi:MAG TPA: RHS repeat-associated core domain-containing protein, partial [Pseudonocardia sp.]|nr:RHS repeat-associated core domain-containing protein [Pseudonocardia sp.]